MVSRLRRLCDSQIDAEGLAGYGWAAKSHGFLQTDQITSEKIAKVKALDEIAKERGQKMSQLALSWVLRDKRVTSVIIGASKVSQIDDAVGIVDHLDFKEDHLERIEKILRE